MEFNFTPTIIVRIKSILLSMKEMYKFDLLLEITTLCHFCI